MRKTSEILREIALPWQRLRGATSPRKARWLQGLLLLVLLGTLFIPSSTRMLEQALLDLWLDLSRVFRAPHGDILLVTIDSDTLSYVPERWPWPRDRFAGLVEILASASPRVLIWDLTLDHLEKEGGSDGDKRLANAFRRLSQVSLVSTVQVCQTPTGIQKRLYRNASLFREAARMEGFAACVVDPDGVFRRFILRDGALGSDGCAFQVFKSLTGDFSPTPPPDEEGLSSAFLAFASRGGEIPAIKAMDLLEGTVDAAILKGKIVLFGPTAPVLQDFHLTSRGLMVGPRILATSLDTLLNRRITRVEARWPVRLAAALLGTLLGLAIASLAVSHPIVWSIFGLFAATVGWGLFFELAGVHLPWGILAASWLLATLAQSGLRDFLRYVDERTHLAEAAAAARVQGQMFPAGPWERGEYSIQGFCQPCLAAGGDYYDFLPMTEDRLMFIIADVTGHGISAAMITCMVKSLAGMLVEFDHLTPEGFSRYVNSLLHRLFKGKRLMTTLIGNLHPASNRVTILNAGHPPAFLVRSDGRVEELGRASYPLGVKPGRTVDLNQALIMGPGDSLVLYTDGIVETINWEGRPYGFEEWAAFLGRVLPDFPEGAPLTDLLAGVRAHAAGRQPEDDITLVVLRRKGPKADQKETSHDSQP